MGDSAEKTSKPGFFKEVKSEYKKVLWPDKKTMLKQAVAVVCISVAMGVIIAVLDYVIQFGVKFITSF